MLLGSGIGLEMPLMSNASEAMVPTALSEADDGPLFSSQYTGSPNAGGRVRQVQPVGAGAQRNVQAASRQLVDVVSILVGRVNVLVRLAVPLPYVVPPNSAEVMDQSTVRAVSPGYAHTQKSKL